MRLVFVIQSVSSGGAQRATINLANFFSGLSWDITILTLNNSAEPAYPLNTSVNVIPLNVDGLSNSKLVAVTNNLQRVRTLRKFVRDLTPDVVIGMSYTANILLILACGGIGVKIVGSERSHPEFRDTSFAWSLLRRVAYKQLDLMVCLTGETEAWLGKNTMSKSRIVIPNGVNVPIPVVKPIVDIPRSLAPSDKIIFSVGRLVESKQFDHLIQSFEKNSCDNRDWKLYIAGGGPEFNSLNELIVRLEMQERIFLLGDVGNLDAWLKRCDLFVFPSRLEGFPNSLLEAVAYGNACISYDCPTGPRDLIHHEINGLLIQLNDQAALTEAINRLMNDSDLRVKFANKGQELANNFSMTSVALRWQESLLELTSYRDSQSDLA